MIKQCNQCAIEAQPRKALVKPTRVNQAIRFLNISRSTFWRLTQKDPTFPKPFKLSGAVTCFDQIELECWVKAQMAKRKSALEYSSEGKYE